MPSLIINDVVSKSLKTHTNPEFIRPLNKLELYGWMDVSWRCNTVAKYQS